MENDDKRPPDHKEYIEVMISKLSGRVEYTRYWY